MTRFGVILPLCQNFQSLLAIPFRVYLVLDTIMNQLWQFFMQLGTFNYYKWPNIEKIIEPSGRTDSSSHF